MAPGFEQALAGPRPVITAEITPPLGGDPSRALAAAESLRGLVQAFNVTDGSRAVMRMGSLALCKLLQERGLVREGYEGDTLRDHLGLPRPVNRHAPH